MSVGCDMSRITLTQQKNTSVAMSRRMLTCFCIFLHLFAFICINLHFLHFFAFICINLHSFAFFHFFPF